MWCIVNLPNGTQQAVKWDPKAIGQECLEKVCKALGIICEMEYFGLEHWSPSQEESRTRQWINLRNRLSCDGSNGMQLMLALRVKFWVPVHHILQESARNLFYMQAKVDLLEGRLNALDWVNAAKLAALLCQADGIRFNESAVKSKCPLRIKREEELLRQQQQQQHQQQPHTNCKERKDKEYVLSFKKRRLSKQKSVENIDNTYTCSAAASTSGLQSSSSSTSTASTSNSAYAPQTSNTSTLRSTTSAQTNNTTSSSSPSPTNSNSKINLNQQNANTDSTSTTTSLLSIYMDYIVRPDAECGEMPEDFLRQIAFEHGKLATLEMTSKSAKYWLLKEIQDLPGYGEEIFNGVTTNETSTRCDISVGANGIIVNAGDEKYNIPFSAIAAAKSFRRVFKLEYVDDHNMRRELEIKLPKHAIAAGLYRSITERHAFYVCDKVRGVVTNQFTRDLKGTIASMFKEDTELGKRYVFDIQHTCREVHDQARRILHDRGIAVTNQLSYGNTINKFLPSGSLDGEDGLLSSETEGDGEAGASSSGLSLNAGDSMACKLDLAIREKKEREAAIERCVDTRISEAMTCKICMDRAINTMFNPCCHVMACTQCAARCTNCPNCRVKITDVVKIYLPPELRTSLSSSSGASSSINSQSRQNSQETNRNETRAATSTQPTTIPKITTTA
ncbi:E3 ubiquitin-protein ligase MYLIP-A [Teleopsis dalmanni]|uniref:E3 ubiquitin-protein ligase MYLIP-A n=1 Tax=Teleopsis dalmanni TaxID=139649 RepID=UPI0018CCFB6B|nr:E3 ubiquitin-protein ligase MYLIP-A [Teleopsis dalmanni]